MKRMYREDRAGAKDPFSSQPETEDPSMFYGPLVQCRRYDRLFRIKEKRVRNMAVMSLITSYASGKKQRLIECAGVEVGRYDSILLGTGHMFRHHRCFLTMY